MSSTFLLLFLGTFLLVQSSFSKALAENTTEQYTTLKPEDEDGPTSAELLFYIAAEHSTLADDMLKNATKLLQDVIADISALNDKNEQITEKLEEYSQLVTEIEKQQTKEGKADNFHKFKLLGNLFELTLYSDVTISEKLFMESLQKNGLRDLKEFFKEKLNEVLPEKYMKQLLRY